MIVNAALHQALGRLRNNSDFALFVRTMLEEREHCVQQLLTASTPHTFHQLQGSAQVLTEILQAATSAPSALA